MHSNTSTNCTVTLGGGGCHGAFSYKIGRSPCIEPPFSKGAYVKDGAEDGPLNCQSSESQDPGTLSLVVSFQPFFWHLNLIAEAGTGQLQQETAKHEAKLAQLKQLRSVCCSLELRIKQYWHYSTFELTDMLQKSKDYASAWRERSKDYDSACRERSNEFDVRPRESWGWWS